MNNPDYIGYFHMGPSSATKGYLEWEPFWKEGILDAGPYTPAAAL